MSLFAAERLAALDAVDVVILGAGVNGAGLFRDLCEQGLTCLLVDKGDFGSGTSAAPSRLIHGGLKYLETGEFGLVAQSTLERNLLLRNAPHCVEPLPTVIPIFSWWKGVGAALRTLFGTTSAPRSRGAVLVKIGLWLYDFYGARHRVMPRHSLVGRRRALRDMPALTPAIVAAGTYYDARITCPERLVLELVQDGLAASPRSAAANATLLERAEEGALTFRRESGPAFTVRPRLVMNAAGPWIDRVNAQLGVETRLIGGTKGSHILLKHDALIRLLNGRMIYFEADDGRICLVFDYLGRALVGSTDIKADNPDDVRCEEDEVAYFLDSLASLLPGLTFHRDQIVYTYSGIRPLPNSEATPAGLISRDHSAPVTEPAPGRPFAILSLVGGKWTTFRGFAEEVADSVLGRLGAVRRRSTRDLPIGGGRISPARRGSAPRWLAQAARDTGLTAARMDTLLSRYGTTALAIGRHRGEYTDEDRLADNDSYSLAELDYILRHEAVVHLADVILRRTTLAIRGDVTLRDLDCIAGLAARALGWDATRRVMETQSLVRRLTEINGMRLTA